MTQITFKLAAGAGTTGQIIAAATTSGPIRIPSWAPDILAIATTTVAGHSMFFYPTTTLGIKEETANINQDYNRRCFGLKVGPVGAANHLSLAGTEVTIEYTSVNDAVRT